MKLALTLTGICILTAGISGLYQRRHEAELKLKSSEANLGRLQDVTDQLEAQLGALERQARQASKYRELGDEIREAEGSLLCKKWFEGEERKLQEETSLITNIKILKTILRPRINYFIIRKSFFGYYYFWDCRR